MNLRRLVAALPWLRSLWRYLPGPLRIPLLVIAAGVWVWRKATGGDTEPPAPTTGDPALDRG